MRVYVAGPYSSDNVIEALRNIGKGEQIAAELFSLGYDPFVPWHNKDFIIKNPTGDHHLQRFYDYCFSWLEVSDVMFVIGFSPGVYQEIKFCQEKDIPVVYSLAELRSVTV